MSQKLHRDMWNFAAENPGPYSISRETVQPLLNQSDAALLEAIGQVSGLNVLELGCGGGSLAVLLSVEGAKVTAVDTDPKAVTAARALAEANGVGNKLDIRLGSAKEVLSGGEKFDLITGRFILHHIEPFNEFPILLKESLRPGGKAVFLENNSRNVLLMLARKLTGKLGIPKKGDDDEYPLEPSEVSALHKMFPRLKVSFPEFLFFSLACSYLMPNGSGRLGERLPALDNKVQKTFPFLSRYSYRQLIIINN